MRLRATTEEDLDFVIAAESDLENVAFILPWTREAHRQALSDPDVEHLIVEATDTGSRVGFVLLTGLTNRHLAIELRRIVITAKGMGFGRATLRAVKRRAFEDCSAHRLWLDVKTSNSRARALYASEGFVEEGILRDCLRAENGFESLAIMALLESEYRTS